MLSVNSRSLKEVLTRLPTQRASEIAKFLPHKMVTCLLFFVDD